jgi:hypothetical protein
VSLIINARLWRDYLCVDGAAEGLAAQNRAVDIQGMAEAIFGLSIGCHVLLKY